MAGVIFYYLEIVLLKTTFDMAGLTTLFWVGAVLGLVGLALKGPRNG